MSDQNDPVVEEHEEPAAETAEAPVFVEAPDGEPAAEASPDEGTVTDAATGDERAPGDNEVEGGVPAEHEGEAISPPLPDVVAQDAMTVGDENFEVFSPEPQVNETTEAAQVAQPRSADRTDVDVHETYIAMDEVITDPSSPLAVQIPDAGRGSLDLPIHQLAQGVPDFSSTYEDDKSE